MIDRLFTFSSRRRLASLLWAFNAVFAAALLVFALR